MGLMRRIFSSTSGLPAEFRGSVAWLLDGATDGNRSAAGINVTEETALTASAVFACVRAIAEDVAKLPFLVYRRTDNGGKERALGEDLYDLLRYEPNPEMSAFDFRSAVSVGALLWGNGLAEIERNGDGTPRNLWPIHPKAVTIKRDESDQLFYEVRNDGGEPSVIRPRDMLHIKGIGDTGIAGYMLIKLGKQSLGLSLAVERFGAAYFGNGARPGMILQHPGTLSENARNHLEASFQQKHGGPDNAHSVHVAEEGMTVVPMPVKAEEAQFLETRQFQIDEVARWFRVPPHKIQSLLRATFSNIEHQAIEYVGDTIMPWLCRWEYEVGRKLIPRSERGTLFAEHLVDALMRADTKSRAEANAVRFQNGSLTINEWRSMENMNPLADESVGDQVWVMTNMAPAEQQKQITEKAARGEDTADVAGTTMAKAPAIDIEAVKVEQMPVFVHACEQIISRETNAVSRKKGDVDAAWLSKFYAGHRDHIMQQLTPAAAVLCKRLGVDAGDAVERFADAHVAASQRELLASDDTAQTLEAWTRERPARMATQITDEVSHGTTG